MLPDAYFAGHFDGEGCITMARHAKIWRLHISVKVAHKPVLDLYKERFGGSIRVRPDISTNKLLWEWQLVHQAKGLAFINAILPFSMEKREQLEVAKEWLITRMKASLRHPSGEVRLFGESCSIRLKELKRFPVNFE